jgi:hypothetical protein
MVDAEDLKSSLFGGAGSSPAPGTNLSKAKVVESVDAADSKSVACEGVRVRVPLLAPK